MAPVQLGENFHGPRDMHKAIAAGEIASRPGVGIEWDERAVDRYRI